MFVNEIFQHNHLLSSKLFPPPVNALVSTVSLTAAVSLVSTVSLTAVVSLVSTVFPKKEDSGFRRLKDKLVLL